MTHPTNIPEEKRIFQRFSARFPAKFKDARENFGTKVSLRDFSAWGAKLTTFERFFVNDSLSIEVKVPDGLEPLILRGQVAWVQNVEANAWDVGLRFHDIKFVRLARLFRFASKA